MTKRVLQTWARRFAANVGRSRGAGRRTSGAASRTDGYATVTIQGKNVTCPTMTGSAKFGTAEVILAPSARDKESAGRKGRVHSDMLRVDLPEDLIQDHAVRWITIGTGRRMTVRLPKDQGVDASHCTIHKSPITGGTGFRFEVQVTSKAQTLVVVRMDSSGHLYRWPLHYGQSRVLEYGDRLMIGRAIVQMPKAAGMHEALVDGADAAADDQEDVPTGQFGPLDSEMDIDSTMASVEIHVSEADRFRLLLGAIREVRDGSALIEVIQRTSLGSLPCGGTPITKTTLVDQLQKFFPDGDLPPSGDIMQIPHWLRQRVLDLFQQHRDAVQDRTIMINPASLVDEAGQSRTPVLIMNNQRHALDMVGGAGHWTIGRGHECDVRVVDVLSVSRAHAELRYSDGEFSIRDLGSGNGTYIDGNKVGRSWKRIHVGQGILLGSAVALVAIPVEKKVVGKAAYELIQRGRTLLHSDQFQDIELRMRHLVSDLLHGEPVYLREITRDADLREEVKSFMHELVSFARANVNVDMGEWKRKNWLTREHIGKDTPEALYRLALGTIRKEIFGQHPLPEVQPRKMEGVIDLAQKYFPDKIVYLNLPVTATLPQRYRAITEGLRQWVFDESDVGAHTFWQTAQPIDKRLFLRAFFGPAFHRDVELTPQLKAWINSGQLFKKVLGEDISTFAGWEYLPEYVAAARFLEGPGVYGCDRECGLNLYLVDGKLIPRLSAGEPGCVAGEGGVYFHAAHTHPDRLTKRDWRDVFRRQRGSATQVIEIGESGDVVASGATDNSLPSHERPGGLDAGDLEVVMSDAARYEKHNLHKTLGRTVIYNPETDLYNHDVIFPNGRTRIYYRPARGKNKPILILHHALNKQRVAYGRRVRLDSSYRDHKRDIRSWTRRNKVDSPRVRLGVFARGLFVTRNYEDLRLVA